MPQEIERRHGLEQEEVAQILHLFSALEHPTLWAVTGKLALYLRKYAGTVLTGRDLPWGIRTVDIIRLNNDPKLNADYQLLTSSSKFINILELYPDIPQCSRQFNQIFKHKVVIFEGNALGIICTTAAAEPYVAQRAKMSRCIENWENYRDMR